MKKIAIFDVDGTIFRSSLLIEVVRALIESKLFPQKTRFVYEKSYQDWLDRKGSYDAYITDVVHAFEQNLKALSHEDFMRVVKQVIAFHKNRTYVYTRDLIRDLKKKGYFILAISHSPKELLDEFCANLGFDKVYGRIYEVGEQGMFTGNTLYKEEISDKAKILKRFIEKEGLNLAHSYGVGDSESDIKFLTFVEYPICFNPNKKLYEHAKKRGWKVVVERKDVVYEIN
ncbi:MAG: HAD-IB family hydrolase [Candidatus Staskawiczbacteria bacterium]|nr:HAD-IB family hydrolase [Candidatus Staskawiczbacteria bacterium]